MASPDHLYEYATAALGWFTVVGVGAAFYFYYTSNQRNRRGSRVRPQRSASLLHTSIESDASTESRTRERRRERRRDTVQARDVPSSDDGTSSDRVRRSRANPVPAQHQPAQSAGAREKESDTDDLAFANELASRKKGTTLAASAKAESSHKTVKQSTANKYAELAASPSIGAEADDDLSSAGSPNLQAEEFPSGNNIADMLEAQGPGPSVLRLTESEKPERQKQNGRQRAVQQEQLTKKQRENKKKAEERKQIREQQEAERRVLLEKQRRTAREARGEPAKNGIPASAPTTNAWSKANDTGAVQPPATNDQLLDTFVDSASTGSSAAPATPASNSTGDILWQRDLPDEDEQMRRILEQDDSTWTTVPTGRRNRRKDGAAVAETRNNEGAESVVTTAPAVRHVLSEQEA